MFEVGLTDIRKLLVQPLVIAQHASIGHHLRLGMRLNTQCENDRGIPCAPVLDIFSSGTHTITITLTFILTLTLTLIHFRHKYRQSTGFTFFARTRADDIFSSRTAAGRAIKHFVSAVTAVLAPSSFVV